MKASVLILSLLAATSTPLLSAVQLFFNDGLHHLVEADNSNPGDGVYIEDSPLGAPTSVTIAMGADLGGVYPGVMATEHSIVEITGGSFTSDLPVVASGYSHITIHSGWIGYLGTVVSLIGKDQSLVDVRGGNFQGGGLYVYGNSVVNVMGGDFSAASQGLSVVDNGEGDIPVINIYGSLFNYPIGSITDAAGTLTGVLADGTPFNNSFRREAGFINLIQIPEPSVAAMAACCLVLVFRRGRSTRAVSSRNA